MKKLYIGSSLATLMMAGALGAAYGADYTPVTDARLQNPEPQNWLMTRGNYQGWSYSPLDQINTKNVKNLVPVWSVSTGVDSGHEAPPIVNNGMMFVATPYSQVMALDAATGELLWRYKRKLPEGFSCAAQHQPRRGAIRRQGLPADVWTRCWWRWTPRPARSTGRRRSRTGRPVTT